MSEFKYKKRIVDTMLRRRLMTMGAVLIEGPKLCGKFSGMQFAERWMLETEKKASSC